MKIRTTLTMLSLASALFLGSTPALAAGPAPLPKTLPKAVSQKVIDVEKRLLTFEDCVFLVQVYDPKDAKANQLGFCLYHHEETRGIFQAKACVGVMIEPDTGIRNAFYGKSGHWGIEGGCDAERLKKKLAEPQTKTTVNPISSLSIKKKKEGIELRLLKDDFQLWPLFESAL